VKYGKREEGKDGPGLLSGDTQGLKTELKKKKCSYWYKIARKKKKKGKFPISSRNAWGSGGGVKDHVGERNKTTQKNT